MLKVAIPLLVIYLALTENLELSNVVLGALVALVVAVLMRPERRPYNLRRLPGTLLAAGAYLLVLALDIFLNGVQVARIVLSPSLPIRPGIITIPAQGESEMGTALCAHSITITPGELAVEIGADAKIYVHCLDATQSEEYVQGAQRLRQRLLRRIVD